MDHLGQPVQRGVRVAPAHGLDESRDRVVVGVLIVIHHRLLLDALLRHGQIDAHHSVRPGCRRERRNLQRVQRLARVAIRQLRQVPQCLLLHLHLQIAQPALLIGQRPLDQRIQLLFRQRAQLEDLRARHQRRVHEEEWVMRRGPDQPHHARLDIRQQHILLRLVEPVDLVNEQDGGLALVLHPVGGGAQHPAHVGDVGFHAAQPLELAARLPGDDLRQGSLPRARRPVEDERLDAIRLNGAAQQLPRPEDMRLADKLPQIARPHPRRQRLMPLRALLLRRLRLRRTGKQVIPRHTVILPGYHHWPSTSR